MSTLYFSGIYNGIIFMCNYYNHINQYINTYLRFPQGAQLKKNKKKFSLPKLRQ